MQDMDSQIQAIIERNKRVEGEKAWEMSWTRKLTILVITYFTAAIFLWWVGSSQYLFQAFVPTLGYLLSTVSLPWLKMRWLRRYMQ